MGNAAEHAAVLGAGVRAEDLGPLAAVADVEPRAGRLKDGPGRVEGRAGGRRGRVAEGAAEPSGSQGLRSLASGAGRSGFCEGARCAQRGHVGFPSRRSACTRCKRF